MDNEQHREGIDTGANEKVAGHPRQAVRIQSALEKVERMEYVRGPVPKSRQHATLERPIDGFRFADGLVVPLDGVVGLTTTMG